MIKAELLLRLASVPDDADIGCYYKGDGYDVVLGYLDQNRDVQVILGGDE